MSDSVTGGCLCGAFRYELDKSQVISAHHCHCRDCQKSTGGGKTTFVMVPADAVMSTGELSHFTVTGTAGAHVSRGFCSQCGSPVMSLLEEMPEMRMVKAGSLDDSSWVSVNSSFWGDSAEPWLPVDGTVPVFAGNPPMG